MFSRDSIKYGNPLRMKQLLKFIYTIIPFKKDLFLLLKKLWKPSENVYKHLHFKQPFKVKIDENTSFKIHNGTRIENEIFWEGLTGQWEKESMKLWIELSKKSKTTFDIGANNGIYALVAKTMNPKSHVSAFEPHPYFFTALEKNVTLNNFEIDLHKKAVSDFDGRLDIEDYTGETKEINVESVTLDTFIKSNEIENLDLLKIDVETFEPQVMKGFLDSVKLHKPTLLIEILNDDVASSVNDMINDLGYLYFNIDERSGIRQTPKVEKSDFYNYLICQEDVARELNLV